MVEPDVSVQTRASVVVREVDTRAPGQLAASVADVLSPVPGETLTVGRHGDLVIGVTPEDVGVSRTALRISPADGGWEVEFLNRNGVTLHQWALAPVWVGRPATRSVRWPRVGLRVEGSDPGLEHWVLLEHDGYGVDLEPLPADPHETHVPRRPLPLTASQLEALNATFAEHLAWPPIAAPKSWPLETAARRLGISPSAVRERLRPVQDRARDLGLHATFSITEPDYLFHLASLGYLEALPARVCL